MDKWNRNDQNEYTGITAQRRNRHRTGAEPATPDRLRKTEVPDRSVWMRPAGSSVPEAPAKHETPAESAVPEKPDTNTEPEVSAEPEAPAESAAPAEPEASADSRTTEESEDTAAQDTPAEEVYVVQGADSRVPPEARRMAAAPYGTGRPGTQQHTGRKRESLPEEGREPARPWREKPGERSGSAAGRTPGNPQRARVHVGYAPGRMSDEMTQQVPVADAARESLYGRDAKAYLEKRRQPFRTEENDGKALVIKQHETLRIVVILLVIIGALLTVILIQRNGNSRDSRAPRIVPQVVSFAPPEETEGLIAPVDLTFTVDTEKGVDGIRLRGEGDRDLDTVADFVDNTDGRHWIMKMSVETGFSGTVILQVRRGGEEGWYDTDHQARVDVISPLGVELAETERPAMPEESGEDEKTAEENGEENSGTEPEGQETESTEASGMIPAEEEDLPFGELKTPAPTDTPAPVTPEPTVTPPLSAEAAQEAGPELITGTTVWTGVTKKVKDYSRPAKELIHMPAADEYTKKQLGVMTFRGDNFRRNAVVGTMSAAPKELRVLWQAEAGSARGTNQTYYGYGWTGQPVIARWSTEVRSHSNITEAKLEKRALKEVIIAGLDGVIRFLDLEDGKITRNSIKLGYPMRGTPSLHTRGYPFMSVGQFARKMRSKTGKIGLRQYNLFTQGDLKMIDGLDGKYHRPLNNVGSFETSALIDRESDTLIAVGSNGMLYLESLGSNFDYNTGVMSISSSVTAMTSKVKGQKNTALLAVESSPAAYDRYVFYADMGGVLRCVDTNTLTPVWAVNTGDSVMAAIAMDLTETRDLNLFTANMLNNRKKGEGHIQIRRYDALSGREIWNTDIGVYKGKKDKDDVGAKASPVIGQHALNDYVYFTVTGLSDSGREQLSIKGEEPAALIALEKETGSVVWAFGLSSRSESSPIALYDTEGNGWIVQCEQNGTVHLIDGLTGSEISHLNLEAEIEASPAAYNNVVVIGTTGKSTSFVYGIEVKLEHAEENAGDTEPEQEDEPEQPEIRENEPNEPEIGEEEPDWMDDGEESDIGGEEADWADGEDEPEQPEEEGGYEDE